DMSPGKHAAPLVAGREGVLHGMMTYVLQNAEGQIETTESISAGLDYPAVGPEHSYLMSIGRTKYVTQTDKDALQAFNRLSQLEGNNASIGTCSRDQLRYKAGEDARKGRLDNRKPLWPRRQGRGHDCKTIPAVTTLLKRNFAN